MNSILEELRVLPRFSKENYEQLLIKAWDPLTYIRRFRDNDTWERSSQVKAFCDAFKEIEGYWIENLKSLDELHYIILSEYPTSPKKDIYNPNYKGAVILWKKMQTLGILVIELLPFPMHFLCRNIHGYLDLLEMSSGYYAPRLAITLQDPNITYVLAYLSMKPAMDTCQNEKMQSILKSRFFKTLADYLPGYNPRQDPLPTRIDNLLPVLK